MFNRNIDIYTYEYFQHDQYNIIILCADCPTESTYVLYRNNIIIIINYCRNSRENVRTNANNNTLTFEFWQWKLRAVLCESEPFWYHINTVHLRAWHSLVLNLWVSPCIRQAYDLNLSCTRECRNRKYNVRIIHHNS